MPATTELLQACWNGIFSAGCRSSISLPVKFQIISNKKAQLIQNLITSYYKKKKQTNNNNKEE